MPEPRKSLMRSLGEFFGHVRAGVRTPVQPGEESTSIIVRKEQEERREGNVILRRTVVEEVEIQPQDTDHPTTPDAPR
jgi:hypothetical protein